MPLSDCSALHGVNPSKKTNYSSKDIVQPFFYAENQMLHIKMLPHKVKKNEVACATMRKYLTPCYPIIQFNDLT